MQHIISKAKSNTHGQRKVYARASGGLSSVLGWDYGLSDDDNHKEAVWKLCRRLDWAYDWTASPIKSGGFVWVASRADVTVTTEGRL